MATFAPIQEDAIDPTRTFGKRAGSRRPLPIRAGPCEGRARDRLCRDGSRGSTGAGAAVISDADGSMAKRSTRRLTGGVGANVDPRRNRVYEPTRDLRRSMSPSLNGETPMYILYGGDFTRAVLVQWVLEEGKLDYQLRKIDIQVGEHRAAEFLAINPAGLVPVLITPEGGTLHEVAALMVYLADRHQLTELAPAVTDPLRGLFLSAVFHIAGDIQSEMKRFHFPHRYSLRTEDNAGIQDQAKSLLYSRLDVMNTRLARGGPYVLGTRFCLADFYLCFWIAYLDRDGVCKQLPSIAKLYELVRSRPSVTPYLEETERTADAYADMMKKNPAGVIA
jgi:glutathione S-transferase